MISFKRLLIAGFILSCATPTMDAMNAREVMETLLPVYPYINNIEPRAAINFLKSKHGGTFTHDEIIAFVNAYPTDVNDNERYQQAKLDTFKAIRERIVTMRIQARMITTKKEANKKRIFHDKILATGATKIFKQMRKKNKKPIARMNNELNRTHTEMKKTQKEDLEVLQVLADVFDIFKAQRDNRIQ